MATSRPLAYNTGATISGTDQIGNLAIGTPNVGFESSGVQFWNGPDEELGYVIAKPVPTATQHTPVFGVTASIAFMRSESLTEESFLDLVSSFFTQNFANGKDAKTWLNNNGYWTSYTDLWKFNSGVDLSWPASTTGYTVYNGGFTSIDDGYSNTSITLPTTFAINANSGGVSSNQLYMSTNGQFSLGSGVTWDDIRAFNANIGDNWLQPGASLTDGDTQNWWYKTGSDGGDKYYVKNIVYGGKYGNTTYPTSWLGNLYIDSQYQWFETRVKSNITGQAGPHGYLENNSALSKVWRGDLNGENWVYLGFGSISS